MMTQVEQENETNSENTTHSLPTPGAILTQAREQNQLSQQDVADSLNLKLVIVKAIEQDEFKQMPAATFTKGYLRSYAKLVAVDENKVIEAYQALGISQVAPKIDMKSFSKKNKLKKSDDRSLVMPFIILLLIIIVGGFLWFSGKDSLWSFKSADEMSANSPLSIELDNVELEVAETDNFPTQAELTQQVQQNLTNETELTAAEYEAELTENVLTDSEVAEPENIEPANIEATEDVISSSEQTFLAEPNTSDADAELTAVNAEPESNQVVTGEHVVSMQFEADCWINILDATGERIAYGVKKAGRLMQVSGQAPFEITLGAPENVQVSYNDQAIDMQQFKKGMVARFSLPLENE
ncbi:DUF4115 domain-containing protein [Catenovulum sp. 2E275]|uniref:RodZ domain-containing protein n=1 Tax=Catenovulum sp. 2E275 TaxID=2980497 RepID=UPI0021D074B0|nr:RodZ domain-containing protein [Catenovulum sp. 2E275]MCU4676991.1 DUF4115 domain-containing protein [Catenovulum sp. 2E275]